MKKAKIVSSSFVWGRISQDIEIELPNKEIITANKWAVWDDIEGDDSDWDWVNKKSRKEFDKLDEDTQEEIKELINNFKLKI